MIVGFIFRVITALIYYTLTLNVNNLGGNPFLNYFWQGLAEMPAYILGKYASDVIGRRWTHILAFLVTALGCIPLVYTVVSKYLGYVSFSVNWDSFIIYLF